MATGNLLCLDDKEIIFLGKRFVVDGVPTLEIEDLGCDVWHRKVNGFLAKHLGKDVRFFSDQQVDAMGNLAEYRRVDHEFGDYFFVPLHLRSDAEAGKDIGPIWVLPQRS